MCENYDLSDPEQALEYLRKEWVEHIEDDETTAYVGGDKSKSD